MAGYDKDFLVAVFMDKYIKSGLIAIETICNIEENAYKLYDRVGKDKFREYASVTPQAIKDYRNSSVA